MSVVEAEKTINKHSERMSRGVIIIIIIILKLPLIDLPRFIVVVVVVWKRIQEDTVVLVMM